MLLQQVGFGALMLPIIGVMEVIAIGKAFGQFVLFTVSISSCSLLRSSCMHHRHRMDKYLQDGPKNEATNSTIILSNLNRFTKFFTGRFLGKFAVKCVFKIPLHLAYVATLPCVKLMSAKQAINNKLQGSVAAYLRCGGVVNNQTRMAKCSMRNLRPCCEYHHSGVFRFVYG